MVFGVTRPGRKPTAYRVRGGHANHEVIPMRSHKSEIFTILFLETSATNSNDLYITVNDVNLHVHDAKSVCVGCGFECVCKPMTGEGGGTGVSAYPWCVGAGFKHTSMGMMGWRGVIVLVGCYWRTCMPMNGGVVCYWHTLGPLDKYFYLSCCQITHGIQGNITFNTLYFFTCPLDIGWKYMLVLIEILIVPGIQTSEFFLPLYLIQRGVGGNWHTCVPMMQMGGCYWCTYIPMMQGRVSIPACPW